MGYYIYPFDCYIGPAYLRDSKYFAHDSPQILQRREAGAGKKRLILLSNGRIYLELSKETIGRVLSS